MSTAVQGLSRRRVIIVGAGHSGLAVGAALVTEGLRPQTDFVVIDAARLGERSWNRRWHSLHLRSSARDSALPGASFPGDQRRHPRADEFAEYLESFSEAFGVRPLWEISVSGVRKLGQGSTLELSTSAGIVQTRNVVAATGAFAIPRRPDWANDLAIPGVALHTDEYQFPRQIPSGAVLVVGGGHAAVEIATELAVSHDVALSARNPRIVRRLREHGRTLAARGPTSASRGRPIRIVAPITAVGHDTATLADGSELTLGSVVFATGYLPGDYWFPDHVTPSRKRMPHSGLPGLFVAGIPGYGSRREPQIASAMTEARRIAHRIMERP